ncbi:MAG: ATP synthase subunit I [Burkholderiales bacterium]|nr:ATP synthase subunit I [Burkholderiales bacterium]
MVQSRAGLQMEARKNKKYIFLQMCVFTIVFVGLYTLTKNINTAFSCLLGCIIVFTLNIIHLRVAFYKGFVVKPKEALIQHKKAMFLKFVANIILFITLILLYKNCNYLALFLGYIITQFSALLILFKV